MTDSPALTTACPQCGSTGPHTAIADCPDPALAFYVPVDCAGCGVPFTIDTRSDVVRDVSNKAGLADIGIVDQADGADS